MLENLQRLSDRQSEIRAASLKAVASDAELADHAEIVEFWMDTLLSYSTKYKAQDADVLTIQLLGIRLFNSSACAMTLLTGGFYQNALSHVRDILETGFLIDDFTLNKSHISEWRESSDRERYKKFRPKAVRTRLDARDGFAEKRRGQAYADLSSASIHATWHGFNLLCSGDHTAKAGPFFDNTLLKAILEELTQRLAGGIMNFCSLFQVQNFPVEAHQMALARTNAWRQKYMTSNT